jgi:hypothetical protein
MAELDQERSYQRLKLEDLRRLAGFVSRAHADLSGRRADLKGQLVAGCLGQGAALHFVDRANGVKDFDLWLFYRPEHLQHHVRTRGRCEVYDFGPSPFGRHPADDPEQFLGRRVDVLCRELAPLAPEDPEAAVLAWLNGPAESARRLRERPLVMLWPRQHLGRVIWDPTGPRLRRHTAADRDDPLLAARRTNPVSIDDREVERKSPMSPLDKPGDGIGQASSRATGVVWRLRAWDDADLEAIWMREHIISMSADEVGDLTVWPGHDALKRRLAQALPDRSRRAIGGFVRYWRYFRLEMAPGDLVLVPISDRKVAVARVLGDYLYDPGQPDVRLRHRRTVEWRRTLNRSDLPDDQRRVVNAPGTICRVKDQAATDSVR